MSLSVYLPPSQGLVRNPFLAAESRCKFNTQFYTTDHQGLGEVQSSFAGVHLKPPVGINREAFFRQQVQKLKIPAYVDLDDWLVLQKALQDVPNTAALCMPIVPVGKEINFDGPRIYDFTAANNFNSIDWSLAVACIARKDQLQDVIEARDNALAITLGDIPVLLEVGSESEVKLVKEAKEGLFLRFAPDEKLSLMFLVSLVENFDHPLLVSNLKAQEQLDPNKITVAIPCHHGDFLFLADEIMSLPKPFCDLIQVAFTKTGAENIECGNMLGPGGWHGAKEKTYKHFGVDQGARELQRLGLPIQATCATGILFSQGGPGCFDTLGLIDAKVRNNALSGERLVTVDLPHPLKPGEFTTGRFVLSNAPVFELPEGSKAKPIGYDQDGQVVIVRQGNTIAASIHSGPCLLALAFNLVQSAIRQFNQNRSARIAF